MGRLVVAALLALVSSSCRRDPPVVAGEELARLAFAADVVVPGRFVRFGTLAGEPHQKAGLATAVAEPGLDPHAVARRQAEIALSWPAPAPRTAVFDVEVMPGLAGQSCDVTLNGQPAGRLHVPAARGRHAVDLPPALQVAGENVLGLRCAEATERMGPARRRQALRLFSLEVRDTPPATKDAVVAVHEGDLRQAGPSSLQFALQAPDGGTLHAEPRVDGGGPARARIRVEVHGQPPRDLWSGDVSSRAQRLRLELPRAPVVRLALDVETPQGVVAWGTPRLEKPAPPDPSPSPASLPKVSRLVLVILDAAGARHFGAYGYRERRTTPNVDRLASEGVLFEDVYSPAGFTVLAMGALWTSQHPDELHNGAPASASLPRTVLTVPELLHANGFRTAAFVRNPQAGRLRGLDRGFEHFQEDFRGEGRGGNALRSVVREWLRAHRDERFLLYLHLREPHFPYKPPPAIDALFGPPGVRPRGFGVSQAWLAQVNGERSLDEAGRRELTRLYDGNLAFADDFVGALRRMLEDEGLLEDTAVVVAADHGESMGQHGFVGHEDEVYGEVTQIPLVMRLPGGPRGRRVQGLADITDVGATLAHLAGLADHPSARASFRGRSLLPAGSHAPRPFVVSRTPDERPRYALRGAEYVYHFNALRGREELYDAKADPGELRDLAAQDPLRAAYYRQALRRFVLEKRRGPASSAGAATLTPEQAESLRALGYVN